MKNLNIHSLFNFRKKTILVTGSSGQIGSSIVKLFLELGSVVYGFDKSKNTIKHFRNIFLVEIFITNQDVQIFLGFAWGNSSCKSNKNLKILVRDENFDQKYVSKLYLFILYIFSKYAHNKFQPPTPKIEGVVSIWSWKCRDFLIFFETC